MKLNCCVNTIFWRLLPYNFAKFSNVEVLVDHDYEIATYINQDSSNVEGVAKKLVEINGVDSIFTGPGFLTLTKQESADWEAINTDILNKFDTI